MMGNFDDRYEIRLGNSEDIPAVMQFIDEYWKKGHILSKNRSFFEYEFLEADGSVNFILAIDRNTGAIEAVHGFLKSSSGTDTDIWGTVWKAAPGSPGFLGMELVFRLNKMGFYRYRLDIGGNPKTTIPIMRTLLRCETGKMKQYYRLARKDDFCIAQIVHIPKTSVILREQLKARRIYSAEELNGYDWEMEQHNVPCKNKAYVDKRFFHHPIYQYETYAIEHAGGDKIDAIIILREQPYKNRKALRIVDYIGEEYCFGGLSAFFEERTASGEYEYIDFYCLGMEEAYIREAGFTLREDNDTNIIPNYFYPFEQKNVDIWVTSPVKGARFCKADGDQDRPN